MVFSDTSLKNGILQTCELLLDLGDTGITGNTTLKAQFTNLVNLAYDNVVSEILQNEGDYIWDDFAYTSFPESSQTLTTTPGSEVSTYSLPTAQSPGSTTASSIVRVIKVSVLDANGKRQTLHTISESMVDEPLETVFSNPGMPQWYKLWGTYITLYPAPLAASVTAASGLKIQYQRDKVAFVVGDTTKEAGFPAIFHYLIPLEASEAWAAIKGLRQLPFIQQKKAEFTHSLGWGIANRNKDQRQRLINIASRSNSLWE